MPGAVRQQSRTGLPTVRSEISFRWSDKAKRQLLKLIKDNAEYRAAFFPTGFVVPRKSGIARNLLLELVKDEPAYLNWLKAKGLIKKNGEGQWVPLDTWTSTSYANPVITQLNTLKRTYEEAYKKYKIKSRYTTFLSVREEIRVDFRMTFPWFFLYKELAAPIEPFQQAPLPLSVVQTAPVVTLPRPAPPVARPRPRAPPSPPPSDHSSSSSPSPSPSPSPPPPPLRPTASSSAAFLTPRPNTVPPRPHPITVLSTGPRPHVRPNAVASSSRVPIKVEPLSSSSSASTGSDSDEDVDTELEPDSDHEMENDYGETLSTRGSVAPWRQESLFATLRVNKRPRVEDQPLFESKRRQLSGGRSRLQSGHEASQHRTNESWSKSALASSLKETVADMGPLHMKSDAADSADQAGGSFQSHRRHGTLGTPPVLERELPVPKRSGRYDHETIVEKRDNLMSQMRKALATDTLDIETLPPYLSKTRGFYMEAPTDDAKLDVLRGYRAWLFSSGIHKLEIHDLLPQCLDRCKLLIDPANGMRGFDTWRKRARAAGATICHTEADLLEGSPHTIRICVRKSLLGLNVEPDAYVTSGDAQDQVSTRIHQYSFLAFARFYYNRICATMEGSYDRLPFPKSPALPSLDHTAPTSGPGYSSTMLAASVRNDGRPAPSHIHARSLDPIEGGGAPVLDTGPVTVTRARLMDRLRSIITADQHHLAESWISAFNAKDLPVYLAATSREAKDTVVELSQLDSAVSTLYRLNNHDMLSNCLAGCEVRVDFFGDRGISSRLRACVEAAGAVLCSDYKTLRLGKPSKDRYHVKKELQGYTNFLAFLKFFYDRLESAPDR